MKTLCQPADGKCSQCDEPMLPNHRRQCTPGKKWPAAVITRPAFLEKTATPALPCKHLGEPTGKVELIKCQTCRGNVRKKFAVNLCEIFGTCLPTYTGDDSPHAKCKGCERYEPDSPAAPA